MHPLGICRISKTDILISQLKSATPYRIHILSLLNRHGWKNKNAFSEMDVYARYFGIKALIVWP